METLAQARFLKGTTFAQVSDMATLCPVVVTQMTTKACGPLDCTLIEHVIFNHECFVKFSRSYANQQILYIFLLWTERYHLMRL